MKEQSVQGPEQIGFTGGVVRPRTAPSPPAPPAQWASPGGKVRAVGGALVFKI